MRRISIAVVTLSLPLLVPGAAGAADHLTRVNEVKLPDGGGGFVELRDPASEPFPAPAYSLTVFGADGSSVDTVNVPSSTLMFNSDPHAFPVNTLPPGAGQVCFTRGMGGTAHIHCVAYGCSVTPFQSEGGSNRVTPPASGQSAQRQADGTYDLTAPTEGSANTSGADAACTGGGGGSPDREAPDQFLAFGKRQDVDRLAVTLTLNETASVTVKGSVNVPGAARLLKLRTVKRELAANVRSKFRLRLRRPAVRAVRAALDDGRRVKAAVQISAEDAARNGSFRQLTIRLKD